MVDPPRSGLGDAMLECLLRNKIKEIIYVSCNPVTREKIWLCCRKNRVQRVIPIEYVSKHSMLSASVLCQRKRKYKA